MKVARLVSSPSPLPLLLLLLSGCGKLTGFAGVVPPLTTLQLTVTGDLAPLIPAAASDKPPHLKVALVWGAQWLTEPFCVLPAENDLVAAVIAAGCRDAFGFVPVSVGANVDVPSVADPVSMPLFTLPSADVMIGDVTSRVAYASLIVYDDHNDNDTLDLTRARHLPSGGRQRGGVGGTQPTETVDFIYGASFISMTQPDQRLAYLEGTFDPTAAFYPRSGCGAPMAGFSIVSAGGFTAAAGKAAIVAGTLPAEDPATCPDATRPEETPVTILLQAPHLVAETGCVEVIDDSSARYREPPDNAPDPGDGASACAHLPNFGGAATGAGSGVMQFVVSGRTTDACQGLTHYTLKGCATDPNCAVPTWDLTAAPPAWWPCPVQAP